MLKRKKGGKKGRISSRPLGTLPLLVMAKNAMNSIRKRKLPLTRSELMRRVRQRDSAAELSLRSALHKKGLRYRVHQRLEKVTVDILFTRSRIAVLVDGCFWHGCPEHATYPKTNTEYWLPKLEENKDRDRRQTARLEAAGWKVIRVWEHDCIPPAGEIVEQIEGFVRKGK